MMAPDRGALVPHTVLLLVDIVPTSDEKCILIYIGEI